MAGREETESVTKKKDPSMTSKKSLERLRQAGVPDGGNCLYCHNNNDDELKVGRLLKDRASGITIHHYCLLFASGLSQRGRGRQGIEGFLPDDIIQEFRRAKRLACRYCTNRGATIGCVVKRCPMTFHFHCGLANGSLSQFFGNFNSYCLEHRPHQETDLSCGSPSKIECPICFCDVPCETNLNVLKTPCCNSTWLHRECVQRQAISSGYFFRCPVCNNKKEFEVEMKMFGIYIPEQDASWEREDGAYQELLERHNECNADKCLCPDGRFFCKGK
ncbi:G2/M phase-specific E3 ubiquitin-protein ligase-like [Antedon mediterranea]|uniref:G2/M phase-specific E3 ubiquitin-protein ligase-like n=1 Tax=Antedon mediterranea TaxID=105859 RepID=UPI003AF4BB66